MSDTYSQYLAAWLDPAVNDWFRRACQNPAQKMHVYFKPGGGLYLGPEPLNDEWLMAFAEPVSPARTIPQIKQWLSEKLRTVPLFGDAVPFEARHVLQATQPGCFDVVRILGSRRRRIGHITGGGGTWLAEAHGRTIGYKKTRKAALAAIVAAPEPR